VTPRRLAPALLPLLLGALLAACGYGGVIVNHTAAVEPKADPQAVIHAALDRIALMEEGNGRKLAEPKVVSITAMTADQAQAATGWDPEGLGVVAVWVVQAEGTFTPIVAGEPVGWVRPSAPKGWIIVKDADATVIASGWLQLQ
jgi:hypothetical protein